jgi:hypothetical protein
MVMNWHDVALGMAGVIEIGVAVVHGFLTQRHMVKPLEEFFLTDKRIAAPIRRIVPGLLQFSTFNWFVGGLALIVAANSFEQEARLATGLLVGSSYLYGTLGNMGDARSSSGLDALRACARSDRLRCQHIRRLRPPSPGRVEGRLCMRVWMTAPGPSG